VDQDKINQIENYIQEHPESSLTEAKNALGDGFSFGELRMVQAWLKGAREK
jgi:hypothetical protein